MVLVVVIEPSGGSCLPAPFTGLEEGVSTRLLVYAAQMISAGVDAITACEIAIASPITDDSELQRGIREIVTTVV